MPSSENISQASTFLLMVQWMPNIRQMPPINTEIRYLFSYPFILSPPKLKASDQEKPFSPDSSLGEEQIQKDSPTQSKKI